MHKKGDLEPRCNYGIKGQYLTKPVVFSLGLRLDSTKKPTFKFLRNADLIRLAQCPVTRFEPFLSVPDHRWTAVRLENGLLSRSCFSYLCSISIVSVVRETMILVALTGC